MVLHNTAQAVLVALACIVLWAGILIPEEHHEVLLRLLRGSGAILVVTLILALRFLN